MDCQTASRLGDREFLDRDSGDGTRHLPRSWTYATGGVGEGEIARLQAERPSYSLKLITAARGTGEYLADAHVRIADSRRKVIFDRDLDGPWLLIDLPPGRYEVQTSYKGQSQIKMTTISHQQLREADFYFDSNGD